MPPIKINSCAQFCHGMFSWLDLALGRVGRHCYSIFYILLSSLTVSSHMGTLCDISFSIDRFVKRVYAQHRCKNIGYHGNLS